MKSRADFFGIRRDPAERVPYADDHRGSRCSASSVIAALDLEELRNKLCNPLAGVAEVHVLYTIDHPQCANQPRDIQQRGLRAGRVHGSALRLSRQPRLADAPLRFAADRHGDPVLQVVATCQSEAPLGVFH
jgi:hypothetical protein